MGFPRTFRYLQQLGATLSYKEFVATWAGHLAEFDTLSALDYSEFSMHDVASSYLLKVVPSRMPSETIIQKFLELYLSEWNGSVKYPDDIQDLISRLAKDYRLAIVTNTHDPDLVPAHLDHMGIISSFEAVVTSIEVGWRKPHENIYRHALERLNAQPEFAIFVGDTLEADFEGPQRQGMTAYLIDPLGLAQIPAERRLSSVFELPSRLLLS